MSDHHQQAAAGDKSFPLKPIHVTLPVAGMMTGDSRSELYRGIEEGRYEAVKAGKRTLITVASIERACASRPPAVIGAGDSKFRELRKLPRQKRQKRKGA